MSYISNATDILQLKKFKKRYQALPWYKKILLQLSSWKLSNAIRKLDPDFATVEDVKELSLSLKKAWFYSTVFGVLEGLHAFKNWLITPQNLISPISSPLSNQAWLINPFLESKDLASMRCLGKAFFEQYHLQERLNTLLKYTTQGQVPKVAKLLAVYPQLLGMRGNVVDNSGRKFTKITALQYALWALDTHFMCPVIIEAAKGNAKLERALFEQYVTYQGLIYEHADGTMSRLEKHFKLKRMIELLTDFCNNNYTIDKKKFWGRVIGSEQRMFPAHIVYQFCCTTNEEISNYSEKVQDLLQGNLDDSRENCQPDTFLSWWNPWLGKDGAFCRTGGVSTYATSGAWQMNELHKGLRLYTLTKKRYALSDKLFLQSLLVKGLNEFNNLKECFENNTQLSDMKKTGLEISL